MNSLGLRTFVPPHRAAIPAEAAGERSSVREAPAPSLLPGIKGHRRQKFGDAASPGPFGIHLKALRESAGFTQEELATIAGLSIHAVSALERGERRRPHLDTVRALAAALDLTAPSRDALLRSARAPVQRTAFEELSGAPLPLALTPLIGRDADVRMLHDWLADSSVRLVTLVGPGGAGKTRLALEIGHAVASEGRARVSYISLAAIRDRGSVASAIAEALGFPDVAPGELPNRIRLACAGHPSLLILDNFEQVLDAAPLIADLLARVVPLRVLVTSRSPLRIRGEREYSVGPLAVVNGERATSPADIVQSPAVRLFVERARGVRPDFCVTRSNGGAIVDICRRLDGLPLGLELAAPWIKVLTVDDLLRRLTRDVLLSTAGPRDLPARQQTINATIAWSYNLLSPNEQRVFRRLGVLSGPFPMEAAAAVLAGRDGFPGAVDDALRTVAGLLDKSLLMRAADSTATRPLYQMLETVRAYAALELAAAGEYDDAHEGLVRYCTREASRAATALAGPEQVEWLDRVHKDLENYRAALSWLIERGRPAEACTVSYGLMAFWLIRGHVLEGLEWYERTLRLPFLSAAAEARALVGAALMQYPRGEFRQAARSLTRALAFAREAGDTETFVTADNILAHVEKAAGSLDSARVRFTRSVEAFRAHGIPWGVGNALSGLAGVALAAGNADEAQRLLLDATSALRQAGPWFLVPVVNVRAILAVRRGDPDEAIALVRASLSRIRELHDRFAFVYAIVPLAAAAAQKGNHAWSARILGAGDAVTGRTGLRVVDASVQGLRAQTEREARLRLGGSRWDQAYAAGRATSIDSLIQEIDRFLERD